MITREELRAIKKTPKHYYYKGRVATVSKVVYGIDSDIYKVEFGEIYRIYSHKICEGVDEAFKVTRSYLREGFEGIKRFGIKKGEPEFR